MHWGHLSDIQKGEIIAFADQGLSHRKIATKVGCDHTTVLRQLDKLQRAGTMQDAKKAGRPRITSPRTDRMLVRSSEKNRKATAVDLAAELAGARGKPLASVWTVRRRLDDASLHGRRPRKKPLLSAAQQKARLEWAKEHVDWTEEQWAKVLWSDESPFTLFPNCGNSFVRRRPGEEFKEECIAPTVKHGGGKINVWGCCHVHGTGPLTRIEGKMDKGVYYKILRYKVAPELRRLAKMDEAGPGWTFQADNDPKHTAKTNKRFTSQNNIKVLPWPSQSPDLNPMENLWSEIKLRLTLRKDRPKSLDDLFEHVQQEWKALPSSYLKSIVFSMPRRIQAVIENHGGHTKH